MTFDFPRLLASGLPAELELLTPVWAGRGYSVALGLELLAGALLIWRVWAVRPARGTRRALVCSAVLIGWVALNAALNVLVFAAVARNAAGTSAPFW